MHDSTFDIDLDRENYDIKLEEISKIEGAASLDIKIRNKKVEDLKFSINEWKRFYTQAIRGKPALAVPQLVSRICGTCSNAHLLASVKAVENALGIVPSAQTKLLRKLLYYGLIIRDHALHLYIFALPDLFGKSSILDFDENDPVQHELLDDTFTVKEAGNQLSIVSGGRSVHAPFVAVGGFLKLPSLEEIKKQKESLLSIRPKIVHLIDVFAKSPFKQEMKEPVSFTALKSEDFSFLDGQLCSTDGTCVPDSQFNNHLNAVIIPYSHARGFSFNGKLFMVGSVARLNLYKDALHAKTKETAAPYLARFPSNNLYDNNVAQAIEILHAIDASVELIDSCTELVPEAPIKVPPRAFKGTGVIEAPRGTLFYELETNEQGTVTKGEIIVPSGQNQILMERAIRELVEELVMQDTPKDAIIDQVERLIRAFDPCMSCASHFLKVKWR